MRKTIAAAALFVCAMASGQETEAGREEEQRAADTITAAIWRRPSTAEYCMAFEDSVYWAEVNTTAGALRIPVSCRVWRLWAESEGLAVIASAEE